MANNNVLEKLNLFFNVKKPTDLLLTQLFTSHVIICIVKHFKYTINGEKSKNNRYIP